MDAGQGGQGGQGGQAGQGGQGGQGGLALDAGLGGSGGGTPDASQGGFGGVALDAGLGGFGFGGFGGTDAGTDAGADAAGGALVDAGLDAAGGTSVDASLDAAGGAASDAGADARDAALVDVALPDAAPSDAMGDAGAPVCAMSPSSVDVSGTVTYTGTAAGRVYVRVQESGGGEVLGGTSGVLLPGQTWDYTVRGLSRTGNVDVVAYVDAVGTVLFNSAVDPYDWTALALTGSGASGIDFTLVDPTPVAPPSPTLDFLGAGTDYVGLRLRPATDALGGELAAEHRVYWVEGADAGVPGPSNFTGMRTYPAGTVALVIDGLSPGETYVFAATAVTSGLESAPSSPSAVTLSVPPAHSVSGTVDLQGLAVPAGATLRILVLSGSVLSAVRIASPANVQPFTLPDVQDGTFSLLAFVDMNDDGLFDQLEPKVFIEDGVVMSGGDIIVPQVVIPSTDVKVVLTTSHHPLGYSLGFSVEANRKTPVEVVLCSGADLVTLADMGSRGDAFVQYRAYVAVGFDPPSVGDDYTLLVSYSDGSSEVVHVGVSGVVDPPAALAPIGTITSGVPTFSWTLPVALPISPYSIAVEVVEDGTSNDAVWRVTALAEGTTSAVYDFDGSASAPLQTGVQYLWRVSIRDQFGNNAQSEQRFTIVP